MNMIKNSNGVQFEEDWVDYVESENICLSDVASKYIDTEFYDDIKKYSVGKMKEWNTWTQGEYDLYRELLAMICEDPDFSNR